MAKQYTKEEKAAKQKMIADLRHAGAPLRQALEKAGVPIGTFYTWSRGYQSAAKVKKRQRRTRVTPELVHVPQAVEPDKIIVLLGTPRNIALVLERFL